MLIPAGDTSRKIVFFAVDSLDLITPKTGLTSFTVYYSVEGGTATAMTTPTVTEIDDTNMPGWYALDIDESGMVALPEGAEYAQVALAITAEGMHPVNLAYEIALSGFAAKVNDANPSATSFVTTLTQTTNDFWKYAWCKFISGDLAGQVRQVTGYNGSTKALSFTNGFTSAPSNGDKFYLINQ